MNRPLAAIAFSLAVSLCGTAIAQVDISNPRRLMFVADATDNIIDIVDLIDEEVVFRIETKYPIDDLVATPYAPVLVYTNIERRLVSVYDLKSQKLAREIELPKRKHHPAEDGPGKLRGAGQVVEDQPRAGVAHGLETLQPELQHGSEFLSALTFVAGLLRYQELRLQVGEPGRHHQIIGSDLQPQLAGGIDEDQVLLGQRQD